MNLPLITLILLSCYTSVFSQEIILERKSHPHFPGEQDHQINVYQENELIPTKDLEKLISQEKWVRNQLERFPRDERRTALPMNNFGYLSQRFRNSSEEKFTQQWVKLPLNLTRDITIQGIALIPAIYPEFSIHSSYGFPKRFKIEAFNTTEPSTPILIADWTNSDFPDPGSFPVLFNAPDLKVSYIKLTVTEGFNDGKAEFFALDEIMVFRSGNNILPPIVNQITASGSSNSPPYWHLDFLADKKSHLGKPLHSTHTPTETSPDFIHYLNENDYASPAKPQITIDLGDTYSIGRLELYAAKDPDTPIPTIALPQKYTIELLSSLEPLQTSRTTLVENDDDSKIRWHALNSSDGRYVRLTFEQLPVYNKRHVLALGEIRIIGDQSAKSNTLATGKNISVLNLPQPGSKTIDTSLLVDGYTSGREIIPAKLYIEQLAKRAIVEQAHKDVVEQIVIARAVRTQRYWTIGLIVGILTLFSLLLWLLHQISARKKAVRLVQEQISADLHDDISGNLGTISMTTDRLSRMTQDSNMKNKLREVLHLSQESYASIKEIIWHTDSEKAKLSDLFDQIRRTARSILNEHNVNYEFPEQYVDQLVPHKVRRNIILLVKESLYNCAKYAKAENITIHAEVSQPTLLLTITDDGCGFDPSCDIASSSASGRGLKNMERRAKLLGANLTIKSTLGDGTQIRLTMPLKTQ